MACLPLSSSCISSGGNDPHGNKEVTVMTFIFFPLERDQKNSNHGAPGEDDIFSK